MRDNEFQLLTLDTEHEYYYVVDFGKDIHHGELFYVKGVVPTIVRVNDKRYDELEGLNYGRVIASNNPGYLHKTDVTPIPVKLLEDVKTYGIDNIGITGILYTRVIPQMNGLRYHNGIMDEIAIDDSFNTYKVPLLDNNRCAKIMHMVIESLGKTGLFKEEKRNV